jgi:hypothetical protein
MSATNTQRAPRYAVTAAGRAALDEPLTDFEATIAAATHPNGLSGPLRGFTIAWRDVDGASGVVTFYALALDADAATEFLSRTIPWATIVGNQPEGGR